MAGDDPNYPASCSVFKYGDRGFMYAINGRRFYEHFGKPGELLRLCEELAVARLDGYVTYEHECAMRAYLRRSATVERDAIGMMDGKEMPWVIVRPR